MNAHLRIARPTVHLEAFVAMYRDGLELEVIGSFEDHDGFDGVMLGQPGLGQRSAHPFRLPLSSGLRIMMQRPGPQGFPAATASHPAIDA